MLLIVCLLLVINVTVFIQNVRLKKQIEKDDAPHYVTSEDLSVSCCAKTMSTKCVMDESGFVLDDTINNLVKDVVSIKKHIGLN